MPGKNCATITGAAMKNTSYSGWRYTFSLSQSQPVLGMA